MASARSRSASSRPATALVLAASVLAGFRLAAGDIPESRLLVVAPEGFHAALSPWIEHKRRGFAVTLAALGTVLRSAPGVDDPERLKRFLFEWWTRAGEAEASVSASSRAYVLLVGDADVMPVRYMVLDRVTAPAFDYAFYPSDLYYADLAEADGSFEDWNASKEGFHASYFGEVRGEKNKEDPIDFDRVDYLPEVAVGRWPASTAEETLVIARKSLAYERALLAGEKPGAMTAAFLAVGGWVDSRGLFDRLAGRLPTGWNVEKRYYGRHRGATTAAPSASEVVGILNAGAGLVCHAGHGQDDRWEDSFGFRDLARVKNADRLPIVISAGCSTARFATLPPYEPYVDAAGKEHRGTNRGEVFDAPPPPPAVLAKGPHNPPGLGERLLRLGPDGAVASIGCNTGSQPCGLTLVEGFVLAFREREVERLGDAWCRAIRHYHEKERLAELVPTESWYPASIFFQGMKFMVFGDPSLPLPGKGASTGASR